MITLQTIQTILIEHQLLKEIIIDGVWHYQIPPEQDVSYQALSYDSRTTDDTTLFFCKGLHFKVDYLLQAIKQGIGAYVAETPFEEVSEATAAIIVTDIKKAMAVIAMAFYDYPQQQLKVIGFTGTKGKTTAAYFAKAILDEATDHKTAMLSTMNTTLDGRTYFKSKLTTPESLDLYAMMREAANNGMTHLIMEVSSQAYKTQRVYGLTFDVGIFLNISPDHIGPIEHPNFDDYFFCKRQLLLNSRTVILNRDADYFPLLAEVAKTAERCLIYGEQAGDVTYYQETLSEDSLAFQVQAEIDLLAVAGTYRIQLAGDFNKGNALSALLAAAVVGADREAIQTGLAKATVPGRMEHLLNKNGASVYIDYAHNYISLKVLLEFVQKEHPDGRIIVVIGSPGSKAQSRRADFGKVLNELADFAILTTDDPDIEDPAAIAAEIAAGITDQEKVQTVIDREAAIKEALLLSEAQDAIVIAGKGVDPFQKIGGQDVPYIGDYAAAEKAIASL